MGFIPVREECDHSYTAEDVCSYIEEAYGEEIEPSSVPLGLSCGQEALESLGYEHEEGDGWFEPDPRIPEPKFPLGCWVVDKEGGVGIVVNNEGNSYAIESVKGWKDPYKYAWYSANKLRKFTLR